MSGVGIVDMGNRSLESELYTGRFDDGLLDLCIGIGLLTIGFAWLAGHVALAGAVPALLIPVWLGLRKRITEPRAGRVEFSKERQRTERTGLLGTLGVGVGALVAVLAAGVWLRGGALDSGAWVALAPLIPALLVAVGLVVVSVLTGARRFLVYAAALVGLAALVTWRGGDPGLSLSLAGGLLCLWAGGIVARFVRAHPDLERE
jgi:hypothetical protein